MVYEVDGPFEARTGLCRSIDMSCVCSRLSYVSVDMSCVCSRLLFDAQRQTERLAECSVPIPPWVVIAGSAFSNRQCDYRGWLVHFGLARFLAAIPTENEGTWKRGGTEETGNGVGGAAECVFA